MNSGRLSRRVANAADDASVGGAESDDVITAAAAMRSPSVHELTALLQEVRALVSCLDFVPNGMCQRRFRDLSGNARLLGNPIAERRTEAVDGVRFFPV